MMKKYAYALAGLLLAGCSGDFVQMGAGEAWGEFRGTFTLQGKIMDARTGQALGGNDLQIKLIQGVNIRDPNWLIRESSNPLMGEYAFADIPLTTQEQAYYKIVVVKSGYIQFESILDFYAYYDSNFPLMDAVYNYIGDVYMQPLGSTAPSYTVNVAFNGKPVPGAVVNLDPDYASTANGTDMAWYLAPYYGYVAALSATTDANGKAVFQGDSLALGVRYEVRVNPVVFEGVPLVDSADGTPGRPFRTISVGVYNSSQQQYVAMSPATPGANPYGLYVVSSSNQWGALDSAGNLVINFSRAITLTGDITYKFTAFAVGTGTLNVQTVVPDLSPDGMRLTLRPSWAAMPNPSTPGGYVSFADANVSVAGYPGTSYNLFGLSLPTGGVLSRIVYTTSAN